MNIMQKIHEAFNCPNKKREWDNVYKPNIKIQSTVKSDTNITFNETFEHINKEYNKIKNFDGNS